MHRKNESFNYRNLNRCNLLLHIYTYENMRDSVRAQWLTWEQQQAMEEFQDYVCELAQQQGKLERSVSYVSILVLWEIGL